MTLFLFNVVLAVIWCAFWGDFTLLQLSFGFLMGFVTLWIAQPLFGVSSGSYGVAVSLVMLLQLFPVQEEEEEEYLQSI